MPDLTKLVPFKPDLSQLNRATPGFASSSGLHPVLQHFLETLPRGPWEGPPIDWPQLLKLTVELPVNKPAQEQILGVKESSKMHSSFFFLISLFLTVCFIHGHMNNTNTRYERTRMISE
jgi:hypothetical protein